MALVLELTLPVKSKYSRIHAKQLIKYVIILKPCGELRLRNEIKFIKFAIQETSLIKYLLYATHEVVASEFHPINQPSCNITHYYGLL